MSFSDWTQNTSGFPTIAQDTGSPIIDAGSLRVSCLAEENASLVNEVVYTPGLLKGIMRSLFRVDSLTGPHICSYGISIFQSNVDIATGNNAYLFGVESDDDLSGNTVFFDKCVGSMNTRVERYYAGTPFTRIDETTIVALEIEWAYEPIVLGGTRFILREGHGTDIDFSNLVDLATIELYVGASPALLVTSAAEGLFVTANTGADSLVFFDVFADLTVIQSLT